MAITQSLQNTLKNVDPTPLYAAVGAGELLVEKLRDAREEVQSHGATRDIDPRTLPATLQAAASARVEAVTAEVRSRTSGAKTLPDQATILLTDAVAQAIMTYAELAHRGKDVVARARGQEGTPEPGSQAGSTTAGGKGGAATAKKSASGTSRTTSRSASGTTRAARKSATSTTKRTASTSTNGRKRATSAKKTSKKAANQTGG